MKEGRYHMTQRANSLERVRKVAPLTSVLERVRKGERMKQVEMDERGEVSYDSEGYIVHYRESEKGLHSLRWRESENGERMKQARAIIWLSKGLQGDYLYSFTYFCSECHLNLNMCTLRTKFWIKGGSSKDLCIYSTLVHLNSSIEIKVCCLKHHIYLQVSFLNTHKL